MAENEHRPDNGGLGRRYVLLQNNMNCPECDTDEVEERESVLGSHRKQVFCAECERFLGEKEV
jgi:hypothetical protein